MDLDFRKGSLIDSYSKKLWTNNNSTEFMVAEKWQSLLFDASSSQSITYDDINNTMPLPTGDFSVRTIIKANSFPNAVNGILEYGDSSWRLGLSLDNTGKIYSLYTQATQSRYQVTSSIEIKVGEWYEIIQTHVSATDSTILYVNNISKTLAASANGSGTETNNQALIGDVNTSGSFFFDGYIASSQVYNHVLTTQERGKLYNEFLHSSYISPPKRNFLLNKNINPNEDGLVSAYDMVPLNGEIIDKTGNGNNGTIVNAIWVKDWLEFNDTDTLVTLTDGTILSGVTKATILTRAKFDTANGTICSKGTSNGSRLAILRSGGNLYFAMENGGTFYGTIADTDTTSYRNIAMVFDGSLTGNDRLKAYIDGVEVTLSYTGTAPSTVVTNSSFRLGLYLSSYFGGTIQEFKVYDDALSLDSIKARHNNYARQVNILEDFSGNWADWIAKLPLWWTLKTWTFTIWEEVTDIWILKAWDKYMECITAWAIAIPNEQAYGIWEFDFYKGLNATFMVISFLNNLIGPWTANSYNIYIRSTESIEFDKGGSALSSTAIAYVALKTWYSIKVTRDTNWKFTNYIKGWAFWDEYVLIDVSGGLWTNPVTDNDFTTSKYFSIDLNAWDRIANIKISKWVIV